MAHVDQPVPRAGGPIHRAPVDGAAGNRDATNDLLFDQLSKSAVWTSRAVTP